ncbi:S41 family peptidase [Ornithinibacillus halotolerans]|uniref:Interphotoreceptor retinoid-binding protein n=1 Tax=Ornithinibacillus halotolerans TaxID=1274357 RepID=A0A916W2V3_9BACI|nr:S41 family peptidase [Ornithinibacillus halotolerans]GGA61832.1 interphotoreceptor retinoid-binding protein [Ornithinibacillus halotolerans]
MQLEQKHGLSEMNHEMREEVINHMVQLVKNSYVFPEVANTISERILLKLSNKAYDSLHDPHQFSKVITADLQDISNDKHLGLKYHPSPISQNDSDKKKAATNRKRLLRLANFGFEKVERLPGNIGYHKTLKFFEPELAGELAIASLNYLANTNAIIFDLRDNSGGDAGMVALICSYLLEGRVHLNNFHWRKNNRVEQIWTNSHIQGPSLREKDVYILTSQRTFSGAEDFAYTLQNLNRATLIGEKTKGGAHPGGFQPINAYFSVNIPIGRAVNPITNDNWEGCGVTPHLEVAEEHALLVAQYLCLTKLIETNKDRDIMQNTWMTLKEKLEVELKDVGIHKEDIRLN